jgi:large subunit ribosomal protein L10Ae
MVQQHLNKASLAHTIDNILLYSAGDQAQHNGDFVKGKKRNFVETIELQITLKRYDPATEKRFSGSVQLCHIPRPSMKVLLYGYAEDCGNAKKIGIHFMDEESLKQMRKNKKLVKKLQSTYSVCVASASLIRKIPRLIGPHLGKAGKFPAVVPPGTTEEGLLQQIDAIRSTVKFQVKKQAHLCCSVANVAMPHEAIAQNVQTATHFLSSLTKNEWENIGQIHMKSTMGPPFLVHG